MITTRMAKNRKKRKISSLSTFFRQLFFLLLRPAVILPALLLVLIHSFSQVNFNELARRLAIYHLSIETGWDINIGRIDLSKKGTIVINKFNAHDAADDDVITIPRVIVKYDINALLSNPLAPVAAITAIDVNSPQLIVRRNKEGKWNFDHLVKKTPQKPTPTEDKLQAEISITGGHLIYTDAKGWPGIPPHNEELKDINIMVTPARTGAMPFQFSAYDGTKKLQKITAGGTVNFDTGGMLIRTDAYGINIKSVMKFLPKKIPVKIDSGTIDARLQLAIDGKGPPMLAAVVDVKNLRGTADSMGMKLPFEIKYGNFDLNEDSVNIAALGVRIAQTNLVLSGTVTDFTNPVYNLHLTGSKINPKTLVHFSRDLQNLKFRWSGDLNLDADINGTAASPALRAKLSGINIGTNFGDFSKITGEIRYADDIITVSKIKMNVFGGSISGDLWINGGRTPNKQHTIAVLRGRVDNIKPGMIQERYVKITPPKSMKYIMPDYGKITGDVSGKIAVKVSSDYRKGPTRAEILTDMRGQMGVVLPVPLKGDFAMAGKVLIIDAKETTVAASLSHLELATPNGIVRASGRLKPNKQIIVDVQASALNLDLVRSFTNVKDVSGKVYLSGTVSGSYLNPTFAGRLHVANPRGMGYALDDVVGDCELSMSPDRFIFRNMVISANNRHIRGSFGIINNNGKIKTNLSLSMPRTSMGEIETIAGIKNKVPFDGVIEGECILQGLPDNPEGKLSIIMHQPELSLPSGTTLHGTKLSLDIAIKDGIAVINDASCDLGGIPIAVTGQIPIFKKNADINLVWKIPTIDLRDIAVITQTVMPDMPENINYLLNNIDRYAVGSIAVNGNTTCKMPNFTNEKWTADFVKSLRIEVQMDAPGGLKIAGIPYSIFKFAGNFSGNEMLFTADNFSFGRDLEKSRYYVELINDTGPGMLNMLPGNMQEIDAGFRIKAENLNQVRRDIIKLADVFKSVATLQKIADGVRAIPTPFSAVSDMTINISGALSRPLVETKLKLTKVLVGNIDLPDIDTALSYDGGPNVVNVEHLLISGRDDIKNFPELQGLSVEMSGGLTLSGHGSEAGQINMSLVAQEIDLSVIGKWLHVFALQQLHGKVSITADITSDMEKPNMRASVDMEKPEFMGYKFDSLSSFIVTVDEKGIWLGRWHNKDNAPDNLTPVKAIGDKVIFEEDAANLSFISDNKNQVEPLQIYGYFPFEWAGPFLPSIPADKDCYMEFRLPPQGLSCARPFLPVEVRNLLPKIDSENGMLETEFIIGGPINNPVLTDGNFKLQIPLLSLKQSTPDLPDKLRRVNLDVDFHPNIADKTLTVMDIRDFSAVFDRPVVTKKDQFAWVKKLVGIREKKLPPYGSLVAKGTVQIDPDKLKRNGALIPASEFADNLRYDIHLQTVRAPIRWREAFNGTVTAFLRLHNRVINNHIQPPILEGLAYAENSRLGYDNTKDSGEPVTLPINPDLSIALIIGEGNSFDIAIPPNIAAKLPFIPTKILPPLSQLDMEIAAKGEKLPITNSFVYAINSEAMANYAEKYSGNETIGIGTYGLITGKLINPIVDVNCFIDSADAKIQLPGGNLNISSGSARFYFGQDRTPSLVTQALATGQVDEFAVEATINGNLLDPNIAQQNASWLTVRTSYAPPGRNPLNQEEIYSRLFGLADVVNIFNSNKGSGTVLSKVGTTIALPRVADLLRGGINKAFGSKILETMNLTQSYDKTGTQLSQYPAMSVTTTEFGKTKYSSFRLGATRTFVDPPEWKLWITYRVPNNKALKNFSINAETNSDHIKRISAQYKIDF
ncbi:MAG: hypothetical protein WCO98_06830 [bacterium]